MLTTLDFVVMAIYVGIVVAVGIVLGRHQQGAIDYFVGGRNLPWWAACFSTVATETSTLTVIGLPAVAYGGSFTFMQLTLGYLIGRSLVSVLLLPRYFDDELVTIYEYLGRRFGAGLQAAAAVTFQITRLLADGVRLFATAIPLTLIARTSGLDVDYGTVIAALVIATIGYTWFGGIRAVIWIDCLQLAIYVAAGAVAVAYLLPAVPVDWWRQAAEAGKLTVVDFGLDGGVAAWLTSPYLFVTAVVGGAVFSMASHGTDQLMVQRLLTCRSLRESQYALVGSAFLVAMQFALFLFVGLLLWSFYGGQAPAALGLARGDEIFPKFIIEELPAGITGLLLAGIVAAAMSTLSSSVNSLASSSMVDVVERIGGRKLRRGLRLPRLLTLGWAVVLTVFAASLDDSRSTVIELGLSIASFTYGALLGTFLLGIFVRAAGQADAGVAFAVTVAVLIVVVRFLGMGDDGWALSADPVAGGLSPVAWPWYPVIGATTTLVTGFLLAQRRSAAPARSGGA
ncbi:MAG: sodium:solute symporter [Woeseiaceae bacterium]|nr:sodium:solute symporter [Woeseiaceae bacterium]